MDKKIDYYIGLDVGTDSVGWAVTNPLYSLLKYRGKQMWGVHLFESGKTAEDRRAFRSGRRRRKRANQRLALLREFFSEEIAKIDQGFYQRLDESRFYRDDKAVNQTNTLFFDKDFKDKDYHRAYPTIFHLRRALMLDDEPRHDVRLLYLAIAHIFKHRGHFLRCGEDFSIASAFDAVYKAFLQQANEILPEEMSLDCPDVVGLQNILKKPLSLSAKKDALCASFGITRRQRQQAAFLGLVAGAKVRSSDLFDSEAFDDTEAKTIQFDGSYEDNSDVYASVLGENMAVVTAAKELYDWSVLAEILKDRTSISEAKIATYEKHQDDLRKLKAVMRKCCTREQHVSLFRDAGQEKNYVAYIGKSCASNNCSTCSREDFYGEVKKLLEPHGEDEGVQAILEDIGNGTFMPRPLSKDNSAIPYQLHAMELESILRNAEKHFAFLAARDKSGMTVSEKLMSILTFRIPYYVGPLNTAHRKEGIGEGFCWMVRKPGEESGAIRPWNFEQKVDEDRSADRFVRRMTNTCTYLSGENVLPKDSLLYCSYDLLNHLNTLRVNGELLPVVVKQEIFDTLKFRSSITYRGIRGFLVSAGHMQEVDELTGMDTAVKLSMKPFADFDRILGPRQWTDDLKQLIEECILAIVLFPQEKRLVRRRIQELGKRVLSEKQIKQIAGLNYSGWGRLSRKFLQGIFHVEKDSGEAISIVGALYKTGNNLMQLLTDRFDYAARIREHNEEVYGMRPAGHSYKDVVEPLYCSPAVKRGIWRTLQIVREIVKVNGRQVPKKIFVEMAREEGEKKRTFSRKTQLQELYRHCGEMARECAAELEARSEEDLRRDKLYLYFTQLGRSMYSGLDIPLGALESDYDIDHIYPASLTKDNSLDNRVLVEKRLNGEKTDIYPLPESFRQNSVDLWRVLRVRKLISDEKYKRLVRREGFSDEERAGFINRQLVETRQSTKAIAEALHHLYPDSEIVFVKAGNVSDFRMQNTKVMVDDEEVFHPEFVKVREVNDYHHAKDAYLNVVVGNVYDVKFTQNPLMYLRSREGSTPRSYSLKRMYDFPVQRDGVNAWMPGEEGTIADVRRTLLGNRVLFTRYATESFGAFYDQMPMKKGSGQIPLKTGDPRFARMDRYGGYNKESGAYFFLVEQSRRDKRVRTLEYVPIRLAKRVENHPEELLAYCSDILRLESPRILIPKIRINTLFRINGFPMHISGRTGTSITFKVGKQLVLPAENVAYLKKLVKFADRRKKRLASAIVEQDGITAGQNIQMYDLLLKKHKTEYAARPGAQITILEKGKEKFGALALEDQCTALLAILVLFKCIFARTDLKLIGGSGQAGTVSRNKSISDCSQAEIVSQSATGLFEQVVDMKTL